MARLRQERLDYVAREDAGYRAATALLLRRIYKYIPGPGHHLTIDGHNKPCQRQAEDDEDDDARGSVYSLYRSRTLEASPPWPPSPGGAGSEPFDEEDNDDGQDDFVVRENRVGRLIHVPAPSAAIPEYVKDAYEEATRQLARRCSPI